MTGTSQEREAAAGEGLELDMESLRAEIDRIRPMLQRDGGDMELVGVEDGVVRVRLQGACAGCAFATLTLQHGVERVLKQKFPDIVRVENVED